MLTMGWAALNASSGLSLVNFPYCEPPLVEPTSMLARKSALAKFLTVFAAAISTVRRSNVLS